MVNLPQTPKEILLPSEQGLIMYWHIGNNKNARATVAITTKNSHIIHQQRYYYFVYLLAVQIANSICMESKKKNMTSNEMLAPNGRHNACIVSNVWTLFSVWTLCDGLRRQLVEPLALSLASCSMLRLLNDP